MSNLPPKPDFEPNAERPRPNRERPIGDSYVPRRPPPIADSYVASDSYIATSYDRRHERPYDGPPRYDDRERGFSRGGGRREDRRDLLPPPRHDWRTRDDPVERHRDRRDRDYPPPRGPPRDYRRDPRDDRHYRRDLSPPDRRRPRSISPSRRSDRRSPRRSISPPGRRPPRSPEGSRPPTPRARVVTAPRWQDRDRPRNRRSTSPRRGWSRSPHRSTRPNSRSPSPEPPEDILTVESAKEKGKAKEPAAPVADADGDIKMREPPPSPPRQPKNYRRSPPTGPRNHIQAQSLNPASPAPAFLPAPPALTQNQVATPPVVEPLMVVEHSEPIPTEPVIKLPVIPVYVPPHTVSAEVDKQLKEQKAHRARATAEYAEIAKAARRAVHELEMATIDLNAARMRREVADSQMERARMGVLGLHYEGVFPEDSKQVPV